MEDYLQNTHFQYTKNIGLHVDRALNFGFIAAMIRVSGKMVHMVKKGISKITFGTIVT